MRKFLPLFLLPEKCQIILFNKFPPSKEPIGIKFKKPIDSFESVSYNDKLWRTIERLEETNEGFLLVLNAAEIPLGIIDRAKIGNFVLNKLGFNLPSDIVNKLNFKNHYPLGIELPRIINLMKQKGDL